MAENCSHNMHNLLPLRGAQARDSLGWSKYINEALELFGADTDVDVRQPPLAAMGPRRRRGVPHASSATSTAGCTTRRCGSPTRGSRRPRSPRNWCCPKTFTDQIAHPRLLRRTRPQRQGGLPALPRLVRRQSRSSWARTADRRGDSLRRVGRWRRRTARARPDGVRRGRLSLGRRGGQPPRVRRPEQRRRHVDLQANALRTVRISGRVVDLAQRLPHRRAGAPQRPAPPVARMTPARVRASAHRRHAVRFDRHPAQGRSGRSASTSSTNWQFTDIDESWVLALQNQAIHHVRGRHDPAASVTVTLTRELFIDLVGGPVADVRRRSRRRADHTRRRPGRSDHDLRQSRPRRWTIQHRRTLTTARSRRSATPGRSIAARRTPRHLASPADAAAAHHYGMSIEALASAGTRRTSAPSTPSSVPSPRTYSWHCFDPEAHNAQGIIGRRRGRHIGIGPSRTRDNPGDGRRGRGPFPAVVVRWWRGERYAGPRAGSSATGSV